MNLHWTYHAPNKSWWANYRWHITEPSEKIGLKSEGWEKVFFRSGWQGKSLKVENIEGAKKVLEALQNGTITAFGGRFRGASYDKNTERMVKQAKRSLKVAIEKNEKGENINIKEEAVVPPSYYNLKVIFSLIGLAIILLGIVGLIWWKKTRQNSFYGSS